MINGIFLTSSLVRFEMHCHFEGKHDRVGESVKSE